MATSDKEKDTSTDTKNKETEETAAESAKLVRYVPFVRTSIEVESSC